MPKISQAQRSARKKEAREQFQRGVSIEQICQNNPETKESTIRKKWLFDLIGEKREQEKRGRINSIRVFYLVFSMVRGQPVEMKEIAKGFGLNRTRAGKILRDLIPRAPQNGIFSRKEDDRSEFYVSIETLLNLLDRRSDPHLRSALRKGKISYLILLNDKGHQLYFYKLSEILKIFPHYRRALHNTFYRLKQFSDIKTPANLKFENFLVLQLVICHQENKHKKPWPHDILVATNALGFNFSEHSIRETIRTLKKLKYLTEDDDFFWIMRGPTKLLLELKRCLDPKTGETKMMLAPRAFTHVNFVIAESPKINGLSSSDYLEFLAGLASSEHGF